ncbi:hypothetical protein J1N35_021515 [Gossypium stocksii]|uniref:Uncharacterized protein n=1 Tax=Gossypium stocksii TaxID=47602 RepID=A0A9D3VGW0_9ROSI|nr:hypothetical protein J1N35_021515 [Gossypium stocksii]
MVQAGSSAMDARDRLRGISEHESICGSSLKDCSVQFLRTFYNVERHGHPSDCRSPERMSGRHRHPNQYFYKWYVIVHDEKSEN